ncbi:MAG: NAD(+)/NADH kinase [Nitrospira sp.]|nr:NAD(+)/NADH kinase [Nitrospira sp.]
MKKIGIVCKIGRPETPETVKELLPWLKQRGYETYVDLETASALKTEGTPRAMIPSLVDMVIVLGGDGTMLSVCALAGEKGVPILGINLGTLGFLTEVQVDKLYETVEKVLSGECSIEERLMLITHVMRQGKQIAEYTAMNDVVVTKGAFARILYLETYINHKYVTTFKSDGLIISTPTGSTAYSLSAGGPILYPTLNSIVLTPICSHMLANRPIVLPDDVLIEIVLRSWSEEVFLTLDGRAGCPLNKDDVVKTEKAPYKAKLVIPSGRDYFQTLRTKLKWGER